jgi:hypothetical protein
LVVGEPGREVCDRSVRGSVCCVPLFLHSDLATGELLVQAAVIGPQGGASECRMAWYKWLRPGFEAAQNFFWRRTSGEAGSDLQTGALEAVRDAVGM